MKKLLSLLLVVVLLIGIVSGCTTDSGQTPGGNEGDLPGNGETLEVTRYREYFSHLNLDKTMEIQYISGDKLSWAEKVLFESLQGILAKKQSRLYIAYSGAERQWFKVLEADYGINFVKVDDPYTLLEQYKNEIKDMGYVSYDAVTDDNYQAAPQKIAESVNNACTIAGQENYLVVEESLQEKMESMGFTKKDDGTKYTSFTLFEKYKDGLNKGIFINQRPGCHQTRDFGIAIGALYFYAYTDKTWSELEQIYDWMDDGGIIMGWHNNEPKGVEMGSKYQIMTLPSDYAENLSVYAALSKEDGNAAYTQKEQSDNFAGTDKHYVAFMLTDGDNMTYHLNDVLGDRGFNENVDRYGDVSWTLTPLMYDFAPQVLTHYYKTMTANDNFICSLSGVGYINPGYWPKDKLGTFADTTAYYMQQTGLSSIAMIFDGNTIGAEMAQDRNRNSTTLQYVADTFSKYDTVNGGFFYFGDRYVPEDSNAGGVTWSNGKPFISLRGGTWFASVTDADGDEKREVELAKLAYKVNNRTKDATVIEGYSVMFLTAGLSDVYEKDYETFVSMLDEDVVVVSCDELLKIMTENVEDKTSRNYINDPDYTGFHYNQISKAKYENKLHYYIRTQKVFELPYSGALQTEFKNGMGSWVAEKTKAAASGATSGIQGDAFAVQVKTDNGGYEPDFYLYNNFAIPNQEKVTLTITGNFSGKQMRVRVFDNHRMTNVMEYTAVNNQPVEVDISKFKGKNISIVIELKNGESQIQKIEIK